MIKNDISGEFIKWEIINLTFFKIKSSIKWD